MTIPTQDELAQIAQTLDQSDDHRVIRRLQDETQYAEPDDSDKKIAIYLDTETTGLSKADDKIIEIGMVKFEYNAEGTIFRILGEYSAFEDPDEPLREEIIGLTGITDDDVRGQAFNEAEVEAFVGDASLIIAHNAGFDRPFCESRFPFFEKLGWACSQREIDWRGEGISSFKLEYIAYRSGFFYEGHRAVIDCRAGIGVLAHSLPESKVPAMAKLLESARKPQVHLWAVGAPFEKKTVLRARGYYWNNGENGKPKAWNTTVDTDAYDQELQFLTDSVYGADPRRLQVDKVNAFNRHSIR